MKSSARAPTTQPTPENPSGRAPRQDPAITVTITITITITITSSPPQLDQKAEEKKAEREARVARLKAKKDKLLDKKS